MNITELLESWKGRAEKAEAELARVQRELDHKKMWANEIAACAKEELEKAHKEIGRVKAAAAEMRDAAEMLWTVVANVSGGDWTKQSDEWQTAAARWRDAYYKALATDAGTGYVRKEDVVPLVEFAQSVARSMPADSNIHRRAKEAIAHAKAKGLT